jgi:hypothetical protein
MTDNEFARVFALRGPRLAWLLGAGCSAAAGIPTATTMIVDFKTRLFCAAMNLARREVDPGDPLWATRISTFFDGQHGFPPNGDPDEYAVAFEAAYPAAADRRTYIEEAVRRGVPSFGHRVLAAMISSGQTPCAFTTNFDPLVERSTVITDALLPADQQAHLTVAALDSADHAERCLRESTWPLLGKLHGDYQSEQLKNVPAELSEQDQRLRTVLVESCRRFGLVVAGYSGRDSSVMDALREAIGPGAFPGGLFWVTRPGSALMPKVSDFLGAAESAGIESHVIEAANFDELAGQLESQADLPQVLAEHIRSARPAPRVVPVNLPSVEGALFPVLRCSALQILALPTHARRLTLAAPLTNAEARAVLKKAGVRAVVAARGREVAAFGVDSELLQAFAAHGAELADTVELSPLADSWALGLLYDGLVRALSRGKPLQPRLRTRGHFLVVRAPDPGRTDDLAQKDRATIASLAKAYGGPIVGTVPQLGWPFAEAVEIRLDHRAGRWWCVFDPHTSAEAPRQVESGAGDGEGLDGDPRQSRRQGDPSADWRRERWARRYNRAWADIVDAWASLLAPYPDTKVRAARVYEGEEGIAGQFTLGNTTAWSRPAQRDVTPSRAAERG